MSAAPWIYLAFSVWCAWFSFNAHRPMRAGARRATLSFAAGWLTTELAIHHIAWQAVVTLVFAAFGAFSAWPGIAGLALTGLSWLALLASVVQAARAKRVYEDALVRGFGADYFLQIRPELHERLRARTDWRRLIFPFPIRRQSVERVRDIHYGRARGVDLHLDIYRGREPLVRAPVLFQIHGGGWVMGSKNEQALPLMYELAEQGWLCVSIDYRLSPHATFPDHLIDCKRALVWVKEHIADYGGDPGFIAVTGGSAGGHLCALMGLTQNDPEYQPGFEHADTRVSCCLPFYGVYDFANRNLTYANDGMRRILERQVMKGSVDEIPEAYDRASPVTRVDENASPFFVIHGRNDSLVPVAEAREFVKVLAEKSRAPHAYAELPGAQHAFEIFPSLRTLLAIDASCRYLSLMYSRYLDGRDPGLESAGRS